MVEQLGAYAFEMSLRDRCYIDTRSAGNAFGSDRAAISYTEGTAEKRCRVVYHKATERADNSKIQIADATIFLPSDEIPASDSRIRVTYMHGRTLTTPVSYGIVNIERMTYGNKVEVNEIKGGSVK